MSMILDALSRAEKERQEENRTVLDSSRYVQTSTIKEDRFKKWVLIALIANFFLFALLVGVFVWRSNSSEQVAFVQADSKQSQTNEITQEIVEPKINQPKSFSQKTVVSPRESTTTNMQSQNGSLLQESQVLEEAKVVTAEKRQPSRNDLSNAVTNKAPLVKYSSEPLTNNNSITKSSSYPVENAIQQQASTKNYYNLSEISVPDRAKVSKYEVNVHVYDDDENKSFVLINMAKYKKGDQLSSDGTYVSDIIPEGVIIDYGSGRVLIERN